jgi:hypothetical protein
MDHLPSDIMLIICRHSSIEDIAMLGITSRFNFAVSRSKQLLQGISIRYLMKGRRRTYHHMLSEPSTRTSWAMWKELAMDSRSVKHRIPPFGAVQRRQMAELVRRLQEHQKLKRERDIIYAAYTPLKFGKNKRKKLLWEGKAL